MVISNTDKGYSWSLGGTLKAEPIYGLKTEFAYIHQVSMSVQDMKGSALNSAWSNDVNVNSPNELVLRPSAYVIPDKLSAMATYRLGYAKNKFMSTEIGLFYTGYTAGTYSYTYTNDMNGDGITNDLIWIPANKEDIQFVDNGTITAAAQQQAFWDFVNQDKYLSSHKGEYADANAARMPWLNRFDLHLAQNFNVGALRGSKRSNETLQVSLDIMNVGNLLNSSWGVMRTPSACNNGKVLATYTDNQGKPILDAEGRPQFTMVKNSEGLVSKTFDMDKSNSNCWYLQLGVKLIFD